MVGAVFTPQLYPKPGAQNQRGLVQNAQSVGGKTCEAPWSAAACRRLSLRGLARAGRFRQGPSFHNKPGHAAVLGRLQCPGLKGVSKLPHSKTLRALQHRSKCGARRS